MRRLSIVRGVLLGLATASALSGAGTRAEIITASYNPGVEAFPVWASGIGAIWFFDNSGGTPIQAFGPNNDFRGVGVDQFNVIIDVPGSGESVTLTDRVIIDNLSIGAGEELTIANPINTARLRFDAQQQDANAGGSLVNDGILRMNAAGESPSRRVDIEARNGDLEIAGSGAILMSDSNQNRIVGSAGAERAIQGADHSIVGGGVIGNDTIALQNHGLVEASQPVGIVFNGRNDAANLNTGTLRASGGATLTLDGTDLDNTGGLVEALDGSRVLLRSRQSTSEVQQTFIRNGTLRTEGSGVIGTFVNNATFDDVAIETGTVQIAGGTAIRFRGSIANDGSVRIAPDSGQLTVGSETLTFDGSGEIVLQGGASDPQSRARLRGQTSGADAPAEPTLLNGAGHTIRGAGDLGLNTVRLDNRGVLDADGQGNGLTLSVNLEGDAAGNLNTGIMQASDGGVLEILGTAIGNTGGTIRALDGSLVLLAGRNSAQESAPTRIVGGTLASAGSGVVRATPSNVFLEGVSVASGSNVEVENGATTRLVGSLTNGGRVNVASTGGLTRLLIEGDVSFLGDGTVLLQGADARIRSTSIGDMLTHGAEHTLEGQGRIGDNRMSLENHGTIVATGSNALAIDPPFGGSFLNMGRLMAEGSGGIDIDQRGAAFQTSGQAQIADGSRIGVLGAYTQTGGLTSLNGPGALLTATGGVLIQGGLLQGAGTVQGDVVNGGGVGPGLSPGTLTIDGDYEQSADGTLAVELFGPDLFDVLDVSGAGLLAGTLEILLGTLDLAVGDRFAVMRFAEGFDGTFDAVAGSGAGLFDVEYGSSTVTLVALRAVSADAVPAPGGLPVLVLAVAVLAARRRQCST